MSQAISHFSIIGVPFTQHPYVAQFGAPASELLSTWNISSLPTYFVSVAP